MSQDQSVLIVGSVAFDDLEMPHGSYPSVLGGAATYSSLTASYLAPSRLVGVVGEDFPEEHVKSLAAHGVDMAGLERKAGKTFRWKGRYSADLSSRETLDTQLNVFADFNPKIPDAYRGSPYVMLGNIHPALQLQVLSQVEKPRMVVADTMNFWITGEPKALHEVMKKVDVLVINDEEARELSGITSLPKAAAEIRSRGPKSLIVKRGEFGALLFDDHGIFFVPAYPLEDVRDPTGAGDSFAGGLIGYLARHGESGPFALRRAMFVASAMGSFCVEDVGPARLLRLDHEELEKRLAAFTRMVDYGGELPLSR